MATEMMLCDSDGMTSVGMERWPGRHYPCTGSMHVGSLEVTCTNPRHNKLVRQCCDHDLDSLCFCTEHEVSGTHLIGRL